MSALEEAGQLELYDPGGFTEAERRHLAGRDPMTEALRWREANPAGWRMLRHWALADARRGRRCSIAFYAELLRRPEYHTVQVGGCPYVVNNTARAGLVRLLIARYPELEHSFERRASRSDDDARGSAA